MNKMNKDGFSLVEGLLLVLVVLALAGVGFYVMTKKSNNTNNAATKVPAGSPAQTVANSVTPEAFINSFLKNYKAGNKAKVDAMVTKALVATSGDTSFYAACQIPASGCSDIFNNLDTKTATASTTDYTAKDGTKGKTITYVTKITSGGTNAGGTDQATATSNTIFSLVKNGNSWLLDDFNISSDNNASISTQ